VFVVCHVYHVPCVRLMCSQIHIRHEEILALFLLMSDVDELSQIIKNITKRGRYLIL